MSRFITAAAIASALVACGGSQDPVAPGSTDARDVATEGGAARGAVYTGRGTAVDATLNGSNTKLCDTGPLPRDGGRVERSTTSAALAGATIASKLYCITTSATNGVVRTIAEGTVWGLDLTVGGNRITADWLHSMAGARCPPDAAPLSTGSAFVTNLRVNGSAITPRSNAPNQKFDLPNGQLVFNQQTNFSSPWHAGRTVIGLRIVLNGEASTDIMLARSQSHIDCP